MITMDVRKDKSRYKYNIVAGEELWIHGKNSKFHYGIVLDCGSSGTRVFIYYWPDHNGNPEQLLNIQQMIDRDGKPVRMKVRPGECNYSVCLVVEEETHDSEAGADQCSSDRRGADFPGGVHCRATKGDVVYFLGISP